MCIYRYRYRYRRYRYICVFIYLYVGVYIYIYIYITIYTNNSIYTEIMHIYFSSIVLHCLSYYKSSNSI